MGRDMSIFQIGESPYQYGAHSNLGTDTYTNGYKGMHCQPFTKKEAILKAGVIIIAFKVWAKRRSWFRALLRSCGLSTL
jgi:hypothetical protein